MLLRTIVVLFPILIYAQDSQNVELLFHWDEDSLVGSQIYDNTYNEIWGIVLNQKEYAVIGSTAGTHFFDVTDSQEITEVAFVAGKVQGTEIIHRDFHDYKNYLYIVADEGESSLQIIDFSTLPDSVTVVYDSSELFERSHNIFIDTATAKMFTTNGTIYTLEDPASPKLLYSTTILKCHDFYVQNDTAYINGGNEGFFIVDFSQTTAQNQTHEVLASLISYPDQGYNHSGWLTSDGNYYVMADETWGMRMKMLDISDLSNIQVVALFGSYVDSNSIPHNQLINGQYLYTAYYHDGLYVHDISNPLSPVLVAYYDTFLPDHHDSYMGAWGVFPFLPSGKILLSDMQSGLFVFEVDYDKPIVNTKEYKYKELNIFPNPANNKITIKNFNQSSLGFQLFDCFGRCVYQSILENKQHQIDVSYLDKGVYFLKTNNEMIKLILQ
ncbi:MAG: choice-of-anchor B family protein [Bacteroidota bacterium]|nr:choice-of-anchor B family protein [Bacteroidota bacterium]